MRAAVSAVPTGIAPDPAARGPSASTASLIYLLLVTFVSLQGDPTQQAVSGDAQGLARAAVAVALVVATLSIGAEGLVEVRLPRLLPMWRVLLVFAAVSQAVELALRSPGGPYAYLGTGRGAAIASTVVVLVLLGLAVRRRPPGAWTAAGAAGLVVATSTAIALTHLPLSVHRSDMLPVMLDGIADLRAGDNPYHLHVIDGHGVYLTYLPLNWLQLVPAAALGLDARFWLFLAWLSVVLLLALAIVPAGRSTALLLLLPLLTAPYVQVRDDVYVAPLVLSVVAVSLSLCAGRLRLGAALLGVQLAMSQLLWPLAPFLLLWVLHRYGRRRALQVAATAVGILALTLLPFLLADSRSLLYAVLGRWAPVWADTAGLTPLVARTLGAGALVWVQAALLGATFAAAVLLRRCRTTADALAWGAAAMLVFCFTNRVAWGYFFVVTTAVTLCALIHRMDLVPRVRPSA